MFTDKFVVIFVSFSCALVLGGATGRLTEHKQTHCHNTNVILDCQHYSAVKSAADLRWQLNATGQWRNIAIIRKNGRKRLAKNSIFSDRILLHTNGSLEIKSLKPEDAASYRCKVSRAGQRDTHVIELSVRCNGASIELKQSNCHGSVILDCKHYAQTGLGPSANLRWYWLNLTQTHAAKKWKDIAIKARGRTKIFKNPGFEDRIMLHKNGSLELKSVKPEDAASYRCKVSRTGQRDAHIIELSVRCNETIKTRKGRATLNTSIPIQEKNASMETTPPMSIKGATQFSTQSTPTSTKEEGLVTDKSTKGQATMTTSIPIQEENASMETTPSVASSRGATQFSTQSTPTSKKKEGLATIKTRKGRAAMTTSIPIQEENASMEATPSMGSSKGATQFSKQSTPTSKKAEGLGCGQNIYTSVSGGFQSPLYPNPYPANTYCKWTISLPRDYAAINITLETMDLEREQDCQNDYIEISDELGNRVGCRHCGLFNSPTSFQIKGNVAVVEFKSDRTVHKTGFLLSYKATKKIKSS